MKANTVSLDSDLASQLGDCEVGEEKQITLTVKVTGMDENGLSAEVTGVEPYEEETEEAPTNERPAALRKAIEGDEQI